MNRLLNFASTSNLPLAKNEFHILAAAHALSIYRSNSVFTFIPKNACSTLRFSIAVANGCLPPDGDVKWIHKNNQTFSADLRSLATASFTFVILRDPLERLVSAYLDKVVDNNPTAWSLTPTNESNVNPTDLSFREFVKLLKTKQRADVHWRPQTDFLVYRNYDRYFDFRAMDEVTAELSDRIGLDVIDARDEIGHASSRFERIDTDFSDMPAREILAMKREGKLPSPRGLLQPSIRKAVSRLYREDIELYKSVCQPAARSDT